MLLCAYLMLSVGEDMMQLDLPDRVQSSFGMCHPENDMAIEVWRCVLDSLELE